MNHNLSRMEKTIQYYMNAEHFMGSALVSLKGNRVLDKGYGFANLEWQIPNSPITKFRLGSITKQFTAAAILLLEEQGKLKISDLIKNYIKNIPDAWNNISLFHLLTHTSAIPNCTALTEFDTFVSTTKNKNPIEQLELVNNRPLLFNPGSQFDYCNSGYVLLGYLIETISGQSYKDFVVNNIFKPLGMNDSGYDTNSEIISHRASGYELTPAGIINAEYLNTSVPYAAGSLYSTTHDLHQWVQALFDEKLISQASLKKMTTPYKGDHGMGLFFQTIGHHKLIFHGGGINGFKTMLMYCPEDKLIVAVLSNIVTIGFAPHEIALKLLRLAQGKSIVFPSERKPIPIPQDILAQYVGTYDLKPMNIIISLEDNYLIGQSADLQKKIMLYPEAENEFFSISPDAQFIFLKDSQGKVMKLTLRQFGQESSGIKL